MKKASKNLVTLLILITFLQLVACSHNNRLTESKEPESIVDSEHTEISMLETEMETDIEPIPAEDSFATILSFGDALCHIPVFNAAYDSETDDYDFSYMFQYVTKYFQNSTVNIGNCETPMAGKERGYSGFPSFNTPEHLAIDLAELGVDIMTTANNHTLDQGFNGLTSTLQFLDEAGIAHVGSARTAEEQSTILFRDLNGINTAFLSYTYGTNGIPAPEGKEFCVNLMNEEFMLHQIEQAKAEGAELIVASMHWGNEYQTTPNEKQYQLAEFLIDHGVQLILGSHPHVLQPMERIKTESGKEGFVIFSQGNFFSNQRQENTRNTAIFNIEVKKSAETEEVTIEDVTYIPIYVSIKEPGAEHRYQLWDLNEIIRSYEAGEQIWTEEEYQLAVKERERCIKLIEPENE